jgi:hypothetical protein
MSMVGRTTTLVENRGRIAEQRADRCTFFFQLGSLRRDEPLPARLSPYQAFRPAL